MTRTAVLRRVLRQAGQWPALFRLYSDGLHPFGRTKVGFASPSSFRCDTTTVFCPMADGLLLPVEDRLPR